MNKEQAIKYLPLIAALADGKEIQVRATKESNWSMTRDPLWLLAQEYRVKPEVRVVWVNHYEDGARCTHDTLEKAIRGKTHGDGSISADVRTVKVTEEEVV